MDNPFFKNNGPFKFIDILKELNLENDKNYQDQNITDIKDLQKSKLNEITFFHSKKYKIAANNTKASFCITTKNLQNELPNQKHCLWFKDVDKLIIEIDKLITINDTIMVKGSNYTKVSKIVESIKKLSIDAG